MRYRVLFCLGLVFALMSCSSTLAQPRGYEFIQHRGKVVRHSVESLPWRIYADDERHYEALLHAVRTWNGAGHNLGLPDLFAIVTDLSNADLVVDWSGRGLPPDKAGGVWWIHDSEGVRISKMVMDPLHRIPKGNRAQILLQEFGHILGLGDSSERRDVMHPVMHTRRHRKVKSAKLSQRDLAAFLWLYTQQDFVPIISTSRGKTTAVSEAPTGPASGRLQFEPIKVELTGSVNIRIFLKNPNEETLRAPMTMELLAKGKREKRWTSLKTWELAKVPAGYRISRDYFSDNQPLFMGDFELLCKVYRTDTQEVLAERSYP